MASATVILNTRYKSKDNLYPVIIRISHKDNWLPINTGVKCREEDWTGSGLKQSAKNSRNLNSTISRTYSIAHDFIQNNPDKLRHLTCIHLRDQIEELCFGKKEKKNKKINIDLYINALIADLKSAKRSKTAQPFGNLLASLGRFRDNVSLAQINEKFLREYQNWMLSTGMGYGGISVYLRALRRVCNLAIKDKLMPKDWYPFEDFKIKEVKTQKLAIPKAYIDKIRDLKIEKNSTMWHHWNYFRFYFNARGMNFIDVAFLKVSDVGKARINYVRRKTGKPYSIAITKEMQEVLNIYINFKKPNEFVFPIMDGVDLKNSTDARATYDDRLRMHNKVIKKIGKLAGIETKITTYVARHSYASAMRDSGAPIHAIKNSMGHESLAQTETYLSEIGNDTVDKWNSDLMDGNTANGG